MGGGELWGEDFGVKSNAGVECENEVELEARASDVEDEKEDLSANGNGGGPCERVWGIHCKNRKQTSKKTLLNDSTNYKKTLKILRHLRLKQRNKIARNMSSKSKQSNQRNRQESPATAPKT